MRFCSLGSGSGGNASLVEASQGITQTRLLVDCGFSLRELTRRLQRVGSSPTELDAIFITHEHGDHSGCALNLAQRYRIPLWTSRGTWRAIAPLVAANFDPTLLHLIKDGESADLGDIQIDAFAVPHDANEPLHLRCSDGAQTLGLITDLGHPSASVAQALQGCRALLLECNHDEAMLRASSYPAGLKRRILGSHGHLSNEAAGELLGQCLHPKLKHVIAAHLSESNNSPELAAAALAKTLGRRADEIPVASQTEGSPWFDLD
ncbi:MBL fold metallo-hydrolase [Roseateles oligotrophus]|uniref:MBL fold metallo-hydrolase n=1 Tax=Roseateles oligotrophus TaxID=1769250 RepID=A0ABT2YLT4_9BURK|nr:MBL fold metallo-hydrolase [Roseateles oligotrophus]MCV2370962.1 MBL fold metallo-hydrolase [Roseateles oligotrophus]